MKIMQINAVHRRLSTGRSSLEFEEAISTEGHRSVTAFSVGSVEDPEKDYIIGSAYGQRVHALLSRVTGLQGYYSSHATRKLISYMKRYQPDVVVLRNLHANYIHLPKLLRFLAKEDIPTVAVLHDCWFYTGKCCHYTVQGCYRWQEACGQCPAKKQYNKSWIFDRSKKMLADKAKGFQRIPRLGVVAVSDWLEGEARKAPVFRNAKKICRIYNWVDTDIFAPADSSRLRKQLGLEKKKIILCASSIWSKSKGVDTVWKLAAMLQPDEHLVMVGGNLPAAVIPQGVTYFPGTDDMHALARFYNLADVFIQPSLEETFGKVAAEALACGTPVVCFNSTANPELVGPGCGTVVPAGDVEAMYHAARHILHQGKQDYAQTCRAYVRKYFNQQENVKAYLKLFQQLTDIQE